MLQYIFKILQNKHQIAWGLCKLVNTKQKVKTCNFFLICLNIIWIFSYLLVLVLLHKIFYEAFLINIFILGAKYSCDSWRLISYSEAYHKVCFGNIWKHSFNIVLIYEILKGISKKNIYHLLLIYTFVTPTCTVFQMVVMNTSK